MIAPCYARPGNQPHKIDAAELEIDAAWLATYPGICYHSSMCRRVLKRSSKDRWTATRVFRQCIIGVALSAAILSGTVGFAMAIDPVKIDEGEHESMLVLRALRKETISADIALRLAEMVFDRFYGKKYTDERSPLVVVDRGDRWEVTSREGIVPGERLKIVIAKTNARILELVSW